jgi:glycosyltransferase involved in cell wall biosynthesis
MPINVLAFFASEYLPQSSGGGGAERRFRSLVSRLSIENLRFTVIGLQRSSVFAGLDSSSKIQVPRGRWMIVRLALAGIAHAGRCKVDVVYAYHSDYMYSLIPAYITSLLKRKPLVVVVHDDWKKDEDSVGFFTLLRLQLKKHTPILSSIRRGMIVWLKRRVIRTADACICVSRSTASYAMGSFAPKNLRVVRNAPGPEWYMKKRLRKSYDVAFLGRVDLDKGIDTLLLAWREVIARDPEAKLLIIGSTENKYRIGITKLVSKLGLGGKILFAGSLNDEATRNELLRSKIFVSPSRKEGFGLAVAEAMALGMPCILSDIPAYVENFSEAALIFPRDDHLDLAKKILEVLESSSLRKLLASRSLALSQVLRSEKFELKEASVIKGVVRHD